jgi:anti-sigma factor RsiW
MTCAQVKRNLPLLAGGDLPTRLERKTLAHLDACPLCRRELEEYRSALARVKAAARAEGAADWTEADWKVLMARVTAETPRKSRASWGSRPRRALASTLAAVAVLIATAFLFKDSLFNRRVGSPNPTSAVVKREEPKPAPEKPKISPPAKPGTKTVPLVQPEYFAKSGGKKIPSREPQAKPAAGQDVLSVTMVSQETGLQVVWFFNKNFEWKGDGK